MKNLKPFIDPSYTIVSFYQFIELSELSKLKAELHQLCLQENILGTILLAGEGVNGTLAGLDKNIHAFLDFLSQNTVFKHLDCKMSKSKVKPFQKLKIKIKKEIITFNIPSLKPHALTGHFVSPDKWNELIQDPDVVVIDTRNLYETECGTFKNAVIPNTKRFTEFPKFIQDSALSKKKKIAMFCTGGIRCEKASSYLISEGFEHVYQLQGGILKYLEQVAPENSLWQGECFIFDNRGIVKKEEISTDNNVLR